jgi:hypothetical protein
MKRYNTGIDRRITGSVMTALVITAGIVASAIYIPSESQSDFRLETSNILNVILFWSLIAGLILLTIVGLRFALERLSGEKRNLPESYIESNGSGQTHGLFLHFEQLSVYFS